MKAILVTAFTLLSLTTYASNLPPLVLPKGVGVNIHFTRGHEHDLDRIAAAGFKFIRMDFGWAGIERVKGQYDWSAYDELTANLAQRGLRPIYILDYSNPLYEHTAVARNPINGHEQRALASPQHPESVAAFARWAAAATVHFKGRGVVWEIWNEPNISFWKPKPNVKQYTALALATCRAIRQANPQATIIGPATSEFPWTFLKSFLSSGVLEYLDAVSVHPYRSYHRSPETAAQDFARLRRLIDRYAPAGKRVPIISSEWGYATGTHGVSLTKQAEYIVRQQLSNLLHGVPISIWYDWINDGPDPANREHNFGTVLQNGQPKPSYTAIRTMTHALAGAHIVRRLPTASTNDYVLLLRGPERRVKLAAWTLGKAHPVPIPIRWRGTAKVNETTGQGGQFTLALSQSDSASGGSIVGHLASAPDATLQLEGHRLRIGLSQAPVFLDLEHAWIPRRR